jgi:diguanylate cyclase (GGDEF)-like protein
MQHRIVRKTPRKQASNAKLEILLLLSDNNYALKLKQVIEARLPAIVSIANTLQVAKTLLSINPNKYFISIASVLNSDFNPLENIDMLAQSHVSVIAMLTEYEDEMRDQLIKRNVVDYVLKDNKLDAAYICNLILRVYKNSSIKVLVVDDSKVSRFVIKRELMLQKFEVFEAENGQEALTMLALEPDIKLVLVDHQMAIINGISFVNQARVLYSKDELLIIGLSSSNDPRLAVKFLKAGANDFISKPFNYEILLCRINQNLDMLEAVSYARDISNTDFLSGLYNRRYFFEQGKMIFESLTPEDQVTVIIFDIDFFKKVNDQHGHDVGDMVIKNFSGLLKDYFLEDIVARIGGEEFAVISQSSRHLINYDYINAFREKVAAQVLSAKGSELRYSCSIGISCLISPNIDEIVAHADKYLYKAKNAGRNQVWGNLTVTKN